MPCGAERDYVATDYLRARCPPEELPGLGADGCGVVFHMLSALTELGRVGMTVA